MGGKHEPMAGAAVSVERNVAPTARAIRLARGVLVAEDAVLVPDPPQSLVDQKDALRVAIVARPPRSAPAERIRVTDVQMLSLDVPGARTSRVVMLRLAEHSRHAVTVSDVANKNLAEILIRTGGDLWATLRELGYVTPEGPEAGEGASGATTLASTHIAALMTFCSGLCDWLPCCRR